MNIQDISRLHEHYARPTLVIEMPAELLGHASTPQLSGPGVESSVSPVLQRIKGSWRSIGLCLCLVVAAGFGGSFLGSLKKEPVKRESAAPAEPIAEARVEAPVAADRAADTSAPAAVAPVAAEAPSAPLAATASAPASAAAPQHAQPPATELARPIAPRPIVAVQAPAPKAPVKVEPAAPKPTPSTKPGSDVKMF